MLHPLEAIQEAHGVDAPQAEDAISYLAHYGYLAAGIASAAISPFLAVFNVAAALMEFQRIAGIPATGQLDEATTAKMAEPRCGVLDVMRLAEFARWRKNRLTYRVDAYVSQLSQSDQNDLIRLAWKQWEDFADIKLTPTTSTPDIVISTGKGRSQGFDGPSGTLAWAYLPNGSDGQLLMRFDIDETWTKDGAGIHMLNVFAHEAGHLLGLDHSRVSSSLMAPYYSPGISAPQENDDIPRIRALYGPSKENPLPPLPPTDDGNRVAVVLSGKIYRGSLKESPT